MTTLAVDVSNYTGPLRAEALACWQAQGVGLVIVQAVEPPPNYPKGVTRQQLAACAEVGLPTDGYVYLWDYDEGLERFNRELRLLDGFTVERIWIDVEDVDGRNYSPDYRVRHLKAALATAEAYRPGVPVGIYTANWYWSPYLGGSTEFADRLLWCAEYDNTPDPAIFYPFGGWTAQALKQYAGSTELCGVSGIDLNVVNEAILTVGAVPAPAAAVPAGLAHLDAVWGHLEAIKQSAELAQAELIHLKQAVGWDG